VLIAVVMKSSSAESQQKFRRNMSLLSSMSKNKPSKNPASKQMASRAAFALVSFFAYSCTLKMEATCSSETSVDFQRSTWRYIPEDRTLQQTPVILLAKINRCCQVVFLRFRSGNNSSDVPNRNVYLTSSDVLTLFWTVTVYLSCSATL
jgi:hypothetical protein